MRKRVGGTGSGCGTSLAALLTFLLLVAAAASRAAAIRDPHLPLPHTPTQASQVSQTLSTQEATTPGQRSGAAGGGNDPVLKASRRSISITNICAAKMLQGELGVPPSSLNLDPLHKYLPQPDLTDSIPELSPRFGLELPDGCMKAGRLGQQMLVCTGSNMTQIPDLALERNVQSVVFTETGIQMVNDVSLLPRSVHTLNFSHGPLTMFDGRRMYQISELESLSLEHNALNTWSFVTAFYYSDAPRNVTLRSLYLHYNLITYPPQPAGLNETVLPLLETLVLSHNPMCNLPGNLFQPLRASKVTRLFLRNCSLSQFYGSPLKPVAGVEVLDLSYNLGLSPSELKTLFEPLQHGQLRELYLANNNYGSVPTEALSLVNASLEVLDLHGSAFQCLDNTSFPMMPRLRTLNLMYCRIGTIRPHTFDGFPVLEELNLDGNGLITVPTEVLLPTLKVLTLSANPRSTGDNGATVFTMDQVDFREMHNLHNMTFEGVPLDHVESFYFNDLHGLQDLRLTSSKIRYIEPFSFVNLTQLQFLYINHNQLQVLLNNTFAGLSALRHLDLSDNSIVFQSSSNMFFTPLGMAALPMALAEPPGVSRTAEGFRKLLSFPQAMAAPIQGTEAQGAGGMHEVKQLKVNVYLPFTGLTSLEHLDLSDNDIRYLSSSQWKDLQQLHTLSLRSNNVQEWYAPVFANLSLLEVLVLSYNSLSFVTEDMVEDFSLPSLVSVDLNHNAFQCDCSISKFYGNINTSVFVEFSSYKCSEEGKILTFTEYMSIATCTHEEVIEPEEKPPSNELEVIIIPVVILLSVVMVSATLYRKRWYLRYLVYKVKMKTDQYKDDTEHYLYDTFVCYSQADRQWVFEHLVAKLEDGGRYRVCVHERDFTVGQEITENIITSVDRSRKVVVVLSPAFVDSSWCMFELQLASFKILDERRNKLILVLLEALPHHRQPKKLRFLLRSRTYLAWHPDPEGQRLFWVRLLRAVAKPTANTSEAPEYSTHM